MRIGIFYNQELFKLFLINDILGIYSLFSDAHGTGASGVGDWAVVYSSCMGLGVRRKASNAHFAGVGNILYSMRLVEPNPFWASGLSSAGVYAVTSRSAENCNGWTSSNFPNS